jgi:hypothetical protein
MAHDLVQAHEERQSDMEVLCMLMISIPPVYNRPANSRREPASMESSLVPIPKNPAMTMYLKKIKRLTRYKVSLGMKMTDCGKQ